MAGRQTPVGDVARVEQQLAELWRASAEDGQAVVRACKLNLVVACATGEDADAATRAVASIAETEPGRSIVVVPRGSGGEPAGGGGPRAGDGLDAWVSAHCHRIRGGAQVCCEQITLEVGGGGEELVPGTVLGLLVEELPVITWWRRPRLRDDPLLIPLRDLSDRFVVRSGAFESPREALARLAEVARRDGWRGQLTDLTWARLEPWRDAVASLFDLPASRDLLDRVTEVGIAAGGPVAEGHFTVPAAYVAGWLASRLGWEPADDDATSWRRRDGGGVRLVLCHDPELGSDEVCEVRLVVGEGDDAAILRARQVGDERRFVRVTAHTGGRDAQPRLLKLPRPDELALLCGILQQVGLDPVFDAALAEAARLAR